MDSSLRPIWFNSEALEILSYPDKPRSTKRLEMFLDDKVKSSDGSTQSLFVEELKSGRRRYICRAFHLESHSKHPSAPAVALLLERSPLGSVGLSQVYEQFKLTQRERQALEFLLHGLTSKEIADQMKISPNTVKAFLRLIMIKMGVSTRYAILGKIVIINP